MYVDIHNHILPGIDDGAPTMDYALDMARLAVLDGTDTMVATPHRVWMLRRDAPAQWVIARVAALQEALDGASIPLKIVAGVEIQMGRSVAADLASGKLLTFGGRPGGWALIEPPFDGLPSNALDNLRCVIDAGFRVVLAHPERNSVIQTDLTFVERCAGVGINFQLTTGSIIGKMGPSAQAAARAILRHAQDWQIVIASDSHNADRRAPNFMSAARKAAAEIVGDDLASEMTNARPRAMATGLQAVEQEPPADASPPGTTGAMVGEA